MPVKTVEMVRRIRDENYRRTKSMTAEEQLADIKKEARKLRKQMAERARKTAVK